jgi:hypothetical protein
MSSANAEAYLPTYLPTYLPIHLSIYLSMALQSFVGPWPLFQFLNSITVGRTPWTRDQTEDSLDGDQPVARPLPTHRTTQIE